MEALKLNKKLKKDGEILLRDIPFHKGEEVEIIILSTSDKKDAGEISSAHKLAQSSIVGIWKERDDINDSAEYARSLRKRAETR